MFLQQGHCFSLKDRPLISEVHHDPARVGANQKIDLLKHADDIARSYGPEVIQARSVFMDENRRVFQVNSDGSVIDFERKGVVFLSM